MPKFHTCANYVAVIKLKQVDHVNHERQVLADVAGHPFITTLITSFSDNDSLYMLVSQPTPINGPELTESSLITALAVKSSPTSARPSDSTKGLHVSTRPKSS